MLIKQQQIFRDKLFTIGQIFSERRNTESQNLLGNQETKTNQSRGNRATFFVAGNIKVRNQFIEANVTNSARASSSSCFTMRVIDLKVQLQPPLQPHVLPLQFDMQAFAFIIMTVNNYSQHHN